MSDNKNKMATFVSCLIASFLTVLANASPSVQICTFKCTLRDVQRAEYIRDVLHVIGLRKKYMYFGNLKLHLVHFAKISTFAPSKNGVLLMFIRNL